MKADPKRLLLLLVKAVVAVALVFIVAKLELGNVPSS